MAANVWVLDIILVPLGLIILIAYQGLLVFRIKYYPLTTVVGVNHLNRNAWVRSIMKDIDKKNILAVQTLRNTIMASTLLASTAILLSSGIAAFISSTSSAVVRDSLHDIVLGAHGAATITVKFVAILICFLFVFLCHMQAIRYTNHVNFLISIPIGPEAPGLTTDYVAGVLARGSNFYTIGTRGFYMAFPLLLWLFGPIPMFLSAIIMVPILYYLDTASEFNATLETNESSDVEVSNPINEDHSKVAVPLHGTNVSTVFAD